MDGMIKVIRHIEDVDTGQWLRLLGTAPSRSFFQSPQCWQLYSAMSFMTPFGAAVTQDGSLAGVVIGYIQKDGGWLKSFFTRRAIINGGPLLSRDISGEALTSLLKEIRREIKGKAIYLETRNFEDYSAFKDFFIDCGFKYKEHLNFHIDTSSLQTMESNLGKSRKRDIKYTLREGARIVEIGSQSVADEEKLKEYYVLLSELYRTKVKTPLFPYEFFHYLLGNDNAKILLVEFEGRIVGGTVCVCLPGKAVYEWFACGWDGRIKNVFPSTVATYAGMTYAAQNGYPRFDMMGAGTPDHGYGVRDFKAKFGGTLVEHGRFLYIFNPVLYNSGKLGVKILKRL